MCGGLIVTGVVNGPLDQENANSLKPVPLSYVQTHYPRVHHGSACAVAVAANMSLPSRDFPAYSSRWGQSVGTPAVTPVSLHDSDEDSPVPHPLPPSSVSIMDAKHYRTASTGDMLHSVDRLHSSQMSSSRGGVTALKSTEFRNPQAQDGFFSPSVRGGAWHNAKSISSMADAIEDTRSTIHALSKSKEEAELDKELTARELERTRKEVAVLQHQLKNLNQSAMTKASPSFAESITPEIARVLTAAEEEIVRLRGEKEQWRVKVESLEQELAVSRDQSALVATQASIEHEVMLRCLFPNVSLAFMCFVSCPCLLCPPPLATVAAGLHHSHAHRSLAGVGGTASQSGRWRPASQGIDIDGGGVAGKTSQCGICCSQFQ